MFQSAGLMRLCGFGLCLVEPGCYIDCVSVLLWRCVLFTVLCIAVSMVVLSIALCVAVPMLSRFRLCIFFAVVSLYFCCSLLYIWFVAAYVVSSSFFWSIMVTCVWTPFSNTIGVAVNKLLPFKKKKN